MIIKKFNSSLKTKISTNFTKYQYETKTKTNEMAIMCVQNAEKFHQNDEPHTTAQNPELVTQVENQTNQEQSITAQNTHQNDEFHTTVHNLESATQVENQTNQEQSIIAQNILEREPPDHQEMVANVCQSINLQESQNPERNTTDAQIENEYNTNECRVDLELLCDAVREKIMPPKKKNNKMGQTATYEYVSLIKKDIFSLPILTNIYTSNSIGNQLLCQYSSSKLQVQEDFNYVLFSKTPPYLGNGLFDYSHYFTGGFVILVRGMNIMIFNKRYKPLVIKPGIFNMEPKNDFKIWVQSLVPSWKEKTSHEHKLFHFGVNVDYGDLVEDIKLLFVQFGFALFEYRMMEALFIQSQIFFS